MCRSGEKQIFAAMGGKNAKATSQELQNFDLEDLEEGDGTMDSQFPWFHIVQWCAEERGANTIWRYDIPTIKARVIRLTENEKAFERDCKIEYIDDLHHFSLDEDHFFLEWAADLLDQVHSLQMLRFELVPAKIKEEMFWRRYFAGVKRVITSEFFIDPDAKDYSHLQKNPIPNQDSSPGRSRRGTQPAQNAPAQPMGIGHFAQPPQPIAQSNYQSPNGNPYPQTSYQQQSQQVSPNQNYQQDGQQYSSPNQAYGQTYGQSYNTSQAQRAADYNSPDRTMLSPPPGNGQDLARRRRDTSESSPEDLSDIIAQLPEV